MQFKKLFILFLCLLSLCGCKHNCVKESVSAKIVSTEVKGKQYGVVLEYDNKLYCFNDKDFYELCKNREGQFIDCLLEDGKIKISNNNKIK